MNSSRGFWSMPPVDLGLHFDGMGALIRMIPSLPPHVARKVLLQAQHRFTGKEALADGIADEISKPEEMMDRAVQMAERWKGKSRMGVYGVLRGELYGQAVEAFQKLSYVHSRQINRKPKMKL